MPKAGVLVTWAVFLASLIEYQQIASFVSGENVEFTKAFKSVPTTVKTFANDTVLLPCYLENAGMNYHVRWLKDRKIIVDSSNYELLPPERVRMYSNHSLQVSRLKPMDTGEYICQVIREEPWTPISQVHAIEVQFPPSVITVPEIGIIEVKLGEEVDISCNASGVPSPIITWLSKGDPLELLDHRPRLRFKATNRHLAGSYECIANNGVGEPARANIQVIIMHPPEVETDTQWVHTSTGLRAQLQCRVTASPAAKVHWFHGHNPVNLGSRINTRTTADTHILLFRNVRASDLGVYTCKAENRIGMAEVRMHLSGVANIAVFKTDMTKNNPTQTTYTLIWEVDSYLPIIEYNLWFRPYKPKPPQKDGVFIKEKEDTWIKVTIPGEHNDGPMHTASYNLQGLTPSTVYEALVTSRNRFGWSKPSSILRFATENGVKYEPPPTEKANYLPVLENDYFEQNSNRTTFLYATPELEMENAVRLESSINRGGALLKYDTNSLFIVIYMCMKML